MNLSFAVDRSQWPAAIRQQRVALVTVSYDSVVDGVALTLNRLVAHLLRRGHEVLVICPRTPHHPVIVHPGTPVVRVPSLPLPIWSEYRLTAGLGRVGRAALAAFRPTVIHIAVQDAMGHAAQRWARRRGIPSVCSHHTRYERYLSFYRLGFAPIRAVYWWGMRRFHAHCAVTLPPSRSLAQDMEAKGIPRVRVWPRGVDRNLFSPHKRSNAWRSSIVSSDPTLPLLLLVSRLRWEKGLSEFARVVRLLESRGAHRHHVVIVGSGTARMDFERLLPNATFLGTLTGEALAVACAWHEHGMCVDERG